MAFELKDAVSFNMLRLRASVADLHLVDDVLQQLRLDISERIHVLCFAVHADWLRPRLCFLILNQACITHNLGALRTFLRIHWHSEADEAPQHVRDLIIG